MGNGTITTAEKNKCQEKQGIPFDHQFKKPYAINSKVQDLKVHLEHQSFEPIPKYNLFENVTNIETEKDQSFKHLEDQQKKSMKKNNNEKRKPKMEPYVIKHADKKYRITSKEIT